VHHDTGLASLRTPVDPRCAVSYPYKGSRTKRLAQQRIDRSGSPGSDARLAQHAARGPGIELAERAWIQAAASEHTLPSAAGGLDFQCHHAAEARVTLKAQGVTQLVQKCPGQLLDAGSSTVPAPIRPHPARDPRHRLLEMRPPHLARRHQAIHRASTGSRPRA